MEIHNTVKLANIAEYTSNDKERWNLSTMQSDGQAQSSEGFSILVLAQRLLMQFTLTKDD